jgi:glycosyltransferase involved in cell wall biosynthesis
MIAFFDYADVFEDFYPHYGVTQQAFATQWANSGNHAFLALLQEHIGDVVWYSFSLDPELDSARHKQIGCTVMFLRSSWIHRQLWKLFYLPKAAWRWRFAYRAFATLASYSAPLSVRFLRTMRAQRPDFIFAQDYASGKFDVLMVVARLLGVPLVAYHSGSRPERYLGGTLRRWTLPGAHRIIASGEAERRMLVNRFRVPSGRIPVILTPIDTESYRPQERETACLALGLDPKRRYLLFVGRLDDGVKRVSAIIEAFSSLREKYPLVDLLILGDGADRRKLEGLATAAVPGRIRFMGWVGTATTKAQFYAVAESLVLASLREGFPTVVGEAMACGTPVLSSRVGAVEELVIDGETGWLFRAGDDEGLRQALERALIQSPSDWARMRSRARAFSEQRVSPAAVTAALRECFSIQPREPG